MNPLKINQNSKIYIICPAYTKTGGPELLHQLGAELTNKGFDTYIAYINTVSENNKYTPNDFLIYNVKKIVYEDIEDDCNNFVIIPETKVPIVNDFKSVKKIVWWLSVDNYAINYSIKYLLHNKFYFHLLRCIINGNILKHSKDFKKADYHFSQSMYSTEFLKHNGIEDIYQLSDYINDAYLNMEKINQNNKEDIVVYNPKKGKKYTEKLINYSKDIKFIPIENMTTQQVKELLLKAKVYIDFGNHPGKDRIPREAAMCGCCIITGKKGSAFYNEDVNIPEKYKFKDNNGNIDSIYKRIKYILENFENESINFEVYREKIKNEKNEFKKDIDKIFKI